MMLQMLSDEHQIVFLKIARLLSLSDNELFIDDKHAEGKLCKDGLKGVSFIESDSEIAILHGFSLECTHTEKLDYSQKPSSTDQISKTFLVELNNCVLKKHLNDPDERLRAAIQVLRKILLDSEFSEFVEGTPPLETEEENAKDYTPTAAKVMLFELILMALADGNITNVEWSLIKEFANYTGVEDFVLGDLRERAEATNMEASKTLALVLE